MTRQEILKMPAIATPSPPWREVPQFDERLWKAWVEKNEQQDKLKFTRRVKVIAIFIVLVGVVDLLRVSG